MLSRKREREWKGPDDLTHPGDDVRDRSRLPGEPGFTSPYFIVLVLAGIGLGFVYDWPGLQLDPHLMLAIVLPTVLYPAAIDTSWRDFRPNLRPILLLAIGLVATTTLAVGIAFKWLVPQAPWAVALALGAVVSPPDAVAATAVLRRCRLPHRIVAILARAS